MRTVSVVFCLLVFSALGYSCPGGWSPTFYGTCVRFFTQAETWNSAKASCQAHGGELITLENSFKIIFFKGWLASIGRLGHEAFIGGHEFSGVWRWDGLHKGRITNRDWSPGEPNNHEGRAEDCLMAWANGRWNDGQCGNRRFYICERRP